MNIIFGDAVNQVANSHTVLELDTFRVTHSNKIIKTYCVIDSVPLSEFSQLENNKHIHQQLIEQYGLRNWQFCLSAATSLMGKWNGELDSFYQIFQQRIENYLIETPDENWTAIINRD
jgi:hypothetical protein